jgi:hypothetical protein
MNKLTALSKLASAYHSVPEESGYPTAKDLLDDRFGYIRSSLRIEDLKPLPKCAEGLNPVGPKFF